MRSTAGDWAGAVAALEQAVALDSATGITPSACHVCDDLNQLADVYLWFDSLDAVVRTARRQLAIRDGARAPLYTVMLAEARRGDSAAAYAWFQRLLATGTPDLVAKLTLDLRLENYPAFDRQLPQLLWAARDQDAVNARWYYLISLRNQGRLREAESVLRGGRLPGARRPLASGPSDLVNEAILALARGDGRSAARIFAAMGPPDSLVWAPGHVARQRAWALTLVGMARASAGDTVSLGALADSVEMWGSRSLYGRDRRAHHYLRGLLHVARGEDEAGVRAFREAMHSPSLGFTRVNLEMARALLRLGRYAEAVAALQPALRGELDASNLYVTRTELHELLAEAFARGGNSDSAAVHYRAVVQAWRRADPEFVARRERAQRAWRAGRAVARS
ncbi:MAG: tetratricopeptide repeat protein [Gemmatimonadota bacterium]